jgi:hypothetical protein
MNIVDLLRCDLNCKFIKTIIMFQPTSGFMISITISKNPKRSKIPKNSGKFCNPKHIAFNSFLKSGFSLIGTEYFPYRRNLLIFFIFRIRFVSPPPRPPHSHPNNFSVLKNFNYKFYNCNS